MKGLKKVFKVFTTLLMTVVMIFTSFDGMFVYAATDPTGATPEKGDIKNESLTSGPLVNEGDVELDKVVSKTDEDGVYKVTLSVKGKEKVTEETFERDVYVAIVLDASHSMRGEKYVNAKKGVNTFVTALLKKYTGAQIALVPFSNNVLKVRGFATEAFDEEDFPYLSGGTNLGAAIEKANSLIKAKQEPLDDAKYFMVILTDGKPVVFKGNGFDRENREEAEQNALNQKNVAEKLGVDIFTIGYGTSKDEDDFLKQLASKENQYITANEGNIVDKMTEITGSLPVGVPAGKEAILSDEIAEGFTYVDDSVPVTPATIPNETSNKISFNLGEILNKTKSVSFKIKKNDLLNSPDDWYRTNDKAIVEYKNVDDNNDSRIINDSAEVYWPKPKYNYTVNYYDEDKDENGNYVSIATSKTELATLDTDINAENEIIPISGYKYSRVEPKSGSIKITATESENVLNLFYKKQDFNYTVNYWDITNGIENKVKIEQDGLTNPKIATAKFESTIKAADEAKAVEDIIKGYDYKENPNKPTIKISDTESENVLDLYYTRSTKMSYTVYYRDKFSGLNIETKTVTDKTYMETYTEEAKDLKNKGYKRVTDDISNSEDTKSVTIGLGENKIVFFYEKRNDYQYTVKYLDHDDHSIEVQDNVVQENKTYMETYTENYIDSRDKGYDLFDDETKSITLDTNDKELIFEYTKRTDLKYTVNYWDITNGLDKKVKIVQEGLTNPKITTATFKEPITSESVKETITGYDYVGSNKDFIEISVTESENVLDLYYKKQDFNYTVNYWDITNGIENKVKIEQDGLTNPKIATAKFESTIKAADEAKAVKNIIKGYNYDSSNEPSITISATASENVLDLYYKIINDLKYTIKYIDKETNKSIIKDKKVKNVVYGTVIKASDKVVNIPGYNFDDVSTVDSITINKNNKVLKLFYTKKTDIPYTVKYLDFVTNNDLSSFVAEADKDKVNAIKKAKFGKTIKASQEKVSIVGYDFLKAVPKSIKIAANSKKNVIKLYYTLKDDLTYTVKYLEFDSGKELHDDKFVENVTYGTKVLAADEFVEISGYTFDNENTVESITVDKAKNELIIYYNVIPEGKVTIEYIDKDGNQIIDPETIKGLINTDFDVKAKDIPQYILVDVDGNTSGSFTEEDQLITFIYEKVPYTGIEEVNYEIMFIISSLSFAALLLLKKKICD